MTRSGTDPIDEKKLPMETLPKETILRKIYRLRGVNVMLDSDLAELYGVKPIRLREQVKRNLERFPDDFMFRLTDEEVDAMVPQNAIPSRKHLGGALPLVFTENGVAMLSSVLRSQRAIEVNIGIMRTFTELRKYALSHRELLERIENLEKNDEEIMAVLSHLLRTEVDDAKTDGKIGFLKNGDES